MKYFDRKNLIHRLPLDTVAKALLARIHDYGGNRNTAFPSQGRLAEDLSISTRYLRIHLRRLEAAGLIVTTRKSRAPSTHSLQWQKIKQTAVRRKPRSEQDSDADRNSGAQKEQLLAELPDRTVAERALRSAEPSVRNSQVGFCGTAVPTQHKGNAHTEIQNTVSDCGPRTKPPKRPSFQSLDRGAAVIDQLVELQLLARRHRLSAMGLWHRIGRQLRVPGQSGISNSSGVFYSAVRTCSWKCSDSDEAAAQEFLKRRDRDVAEAEIAERGPLPGSEPVQAGWHAETIDEEELASLVEQHP